MVCVIDVAKAHKSVLTQQTLEEDEDEEEEEIIS